VADPRWSPDGRRLAWVRLGAEAPEIVVTGADGAAPLLAFRTDPPVASIRPGNGGALAWLGNDRLLAVTAERQLAEFVVGPGTVPGAVPGPVRFALEGSISAPVVAPGGRQLAFVVETADSCRVMVAPLDGSAPPRPVSGADWAWDPTWSGSGLLAWHEWDFPAMSWDSSRIVVADCTDPVERPVVVAGGDGVAVGQPRFAPAADHLAYVSDEGGWWNVWMEPDPRAGATTGRRSVLAEPSEHAEPAWGVGQRSFSWSPAGDRFAVNRNEGGFGRLVVVDADGRLSEIGKGWHHVLDWGPAGIVAVRSGARTAPTVVVSPPDGGPRRVLDGGAPAGVDPEQLREPELVSWPGADGEEIHGLLWRPTDGRNGNGREGGRAAPLVVDVHGGPTGQATVAWDLRLQDLAARGWAVLRPDPRGSTGWGRRYRQALAGRWGELDVDDVAAGIRAAGAQGWGDPSRVALSGGSSGGMLALLVCARHPGLVRAAVVSYPVTDLLELAATTHRFESHYSDQLVGPLPDAADAYRARSPITHAARIRTPLLVLQGDADVVVGRAQVDRFVDVVRAAGGTVEYHVYAGEGHGWSRPHTVVDALARTDDFLSRNLGTR
jgi:dipeptidyl aminopeptidase/acylaminoacyl peptidase